MSHAHDTSHAAPTDIALPPGSLWTKMPIIAGGIGVVALGGAAALGMNDLKQFYFSYLTAFLTVLSLAIGGLLFVLIQFAARAGWSVTVRRMAENAMSTMPLFIVLFIPIVLGMHDLFHWTHKDVVAADPILKAKAGYLNENFFFMRAGAYLLIWCALAWYFYRQSTKQDETGNIAHTHNMQRASGVAILVMGLTLTFAAFDWIMSLDPHWYSTIFGAYYFAGSTVATYAFMILVGLALRSGGLLKTAISYEHFQDLGKLLFGFNVFWAYLAFSQFFLIWYGNIPEETVWFKHRLEGSWFYVTMALTFGHFVVPFFFLMTRSTKRHGFFLALGAVWMILTHYLDMYWLVMPTLHPHGAHPHLIDALTLIGIFGLFFAVVTFRMRRHALIPKRDPRLHEALAFENT